MSAGGSAPPDEARVSLARTFILIVLVEIVTVTALYVFSRHFAQL